MAENINTAPLFPWVPDRMEDIGVEYTRKQDLTDFQVGAWAVDDYANRPFIVRAGTYILDGRQEVERFKNFFNKMRGQQGPFWHRTHECNIDVLPPATWTSSVQIRQAGMAGLMSGLRGRGAVGFLFRNGWQYREINRFDPTGDPEVETMLLKSSINLSDLSDLIMVSFLEACRFASDALEIQWETDSIARIKVMVRMFDTEVSDGYYAP